MSTKTSWDEWEIIALKYLQSHNYHIIDSNFKFGRFGEIDLVAKKDDLTIFFEVKYRANEKYGLPEESVTKSKLHKLKRTVDYYCVKNWINFEKIQFDVIAIQKLENKFRVKHFRNIEI